MPQKITVEVWEDIFTNRDPLYHPLMGGLYTNKAGEFKFGKNLPFSFSGQLEDITLFNDVRVFYVMLHDEEDTPENRELRTNPIRNLILQRLTKEDHSWYVGYGGKQWSGESQDYVELQDEFLDKCEVPYKIYPNRPVRNWTREKGWHVIYGVYWQRILIEIPQNLISDILPNIWKNAIIGETIEGYCMGSGRLTQIQSWKNKEMNASLFREILDQVYCAFFTFPSENTHFMIVTNKFNLEDLLQMIDVNDLKGSINL